MKQIFMLCVALVLTGCASTLRYRPAPAEKLSTAQLVRSTGEVVPWQLPFMALSHFDGKNVRLIVLSEVGVKLLDANVTPAQTEVYYKISQLPAAAVAAFARFARASLAQTCPSREIDYQDAPSRAEFKGEAVCP